MRFVGPAVACAAGWLWACGDEAGPVRPVKPPQILDAAVLEFGTEPDAAVAADAGVGGRRLLRVEVGAAGEGADGSQDRPFATADDAFTVARAGDLVLLGEGLHAAWSGSPPEGVEVDGVGREATRVPGPVRLETPGVALRNLTIEGGAPGLLVRADAEVEAVLVRGASEAGIEVVEARFTGLALEVVETDGIGLRCQGVELTLEGLTVSGARGGGVRLTGSHGQVTAVVVRDVTLDEEGVRAHGLEVEGGEIEASAVDVAAVGDRAVRLAAQAQVSLRDVTLSEPLADGLAVLSGARATVQDLRVRGAASVSVTAVEGDLELSDADVEGGGRTAVLLTKSHVTLERVAVHDFADRGVSLLQAEGRLSGLTVTGPGGVGIQITEARGPLVLEDVEVVRVRSTGVAVFGASAGEPVTLRRVQVRETSLEADFAEGVHLYDTDAHLEGVVSEGNAGAGLLVEGARADVSGGRLSGNGGPGVVALESPRLALEGVELRGNRGAGALVIGGHAVLAHNRMLESVAADDGTADGLELVQGAVAVSDADELSGNAGNGLYLLGDARITATDLVAVSNGGYGVYVSCDDSAAVLAGAPRLEGNGLGERNACP